MSKRINWKKGMRLSAEILLSSDECAWENMLPILSAATAGRCGLIPSERQFYVNLSFGDNRVEIDSMDCLAVTSGGHIVDICFSSASVSPATAKIDIPVEERSESYYLIVYVFDEVLVENQEGFLQPAYRFGMISDNTSIPGNAFPLARIINQYGWRVDEVSYVPPCLFINSHPVYLDLYGRVKTCIKALCQTCAGDHYGWMVTHVLWPVVESVRIELEQEVETMTPSQLLSKILKCTSAFVCGCTLDKYISLSDAGKFSEFAQTSFSMKEVRFRIEEGLNLCGEIMRKMEKVVSEPFEDDTETIQPEIKINEEDEKRRRFGFEV